MIMFTSKDDIISLHPGLGTLIRNRYGLWLGNEKLMLAACGYSRHADDASMPIIREAWQALHNCLRCLFPNSFRGKSNEARATLSQGRTHE